MPAARILVLGAGFAGLWSAIGAVRKLDELAASAEVTLVNRDAFHAIRVRNYESDLSELRVPLAPLLEPLGIRSIEGTTTDIDTVGKCVTVATAAGTQTLDYDRLVFALGSALPRSPLAATAHAVDTYADADRLQRHLAALPTQPASPARFTVAVVGAGLTGIEVAAEMPARLRSLGAGKAARVVLLDHHGIGAALGSDAAAVVVGALAEIGVEQRPNVRVTAVDATGLTLDPGESIAAATVIWCAGMHAHPLAVRLGGTTDQFGRVEVDSYLRVVGVPDVFAAGDAAALCVDGTRSSVMSCQHSRPMGRFAGHNVVADLFGVPLLPLCIEWYVTVLDLGEWGALYTEGWQRRVVATGAIAKQTKQTINHERIYPPRNGDRRALLDAAVPVVQAPPSYRG